MKLLLYIFFITISFTCFSHQNNIGKHLIIIQDIETTDGFKNITIYDKFNNKIDVFLVEFTNNVCKFYVNLEHGFYKLEYEQSIKQDYLIDNFNTLGFKNIIPTNKVFQFYVKNNCLVPKIYQIE